MLDDAPVLAKFKLWYHNIRISCVCIILCLVWTFEENAMMSNVQ